jgi:large subunit ribosomal protein L3
MTGHLGDVTRTVQNLEIAVDAERKLLLVKGAIPVPGGKVIVTRPSRPKLKERM